MKFLEWKFVDGLLIGYLPTSQGYAAVHDKQGRPHVALFDLDGTLINTKSGELHAQNDKDWVWCDPVVSKKLKSLYQEGFHIIILTNQGRLTTLSGDESLEASLFKAKLDYVFGELGIPPTVYAACANDMWRKPRIGAWDKMQKDFTHKGFVIRWDQAFLVGDAAGRPKDHSDSDWHFCLNTGMEFYTPEEFFIGGIREPRGHKFDPTLYLTSPMNKIERAISDLTTQTVPALIVFVGLPGSGKSTAFKKHMQIDNIAYIDPQTTAALSPLKVAKNHLLKKQNVVVGRKFQTRRKIQLKLKEFSDDCHTRRSERNQWILTGRKCSARIIAICFLSPLELCIHNDSVRAFGKYSSNQSKKPVYPRNTFKLLAREFEMPTTIEGFDAIVEVDFEWTGTPEELIEWKKHWI